MAAAVGASIGVDVVSRAEVFTGFGCELAIVFGLTLRVTAVVDVVAAVVGFGVVVVVVLVVFRDHLQVVPFMVVVGGGSVVHPYSSVNRYVQSKINGMTSGSHSALSSGGVL